MNYIVVFFKRLRIALGTDPVKFLYISKEICCITKDLNFRISRLSKRGFDGDKKREKVIARILFLH